MKTRTKILIGALVGLNAFQAYLVHWWSGWALETLERVEKRLLDVADRTEGDITQSLCEAMAFMHNEDHATSMKDVAKPEEFAEEAKRLLDALLEVSRGR
jgi:hypothetical protein